MRPEIIIEKEKNIYSTRILSKDQIKLVDSQLGVDMSDFITTRENRLKPVVVKKAINNVVFTSQNAVEALLTSRLAILREVSGSTSNCLAIDNASASRSSTGIQRFTSPNALASLAIMLSSANISSMALTRPSI